MTLHTVCHVDGPVSVVVGRFGRTDLTFAAALAVTVSLRRKIRRIVVDDCVQMTRLHRSFLKPFREAKIAVIRCRRYFPSGCLVAGSFQI